ncbi:hypothetical protein [Roseovarius sp.]|uniref:hypothetical protein n=1 Tax=Roseovarius sp. TaxID=1486281 RepID=UPI00356178DA
MVLKRSVMDVAAVCVFAYAIFDLSSFNVAPSYSVAPRLRVDDIYDDAALAQWLKTQCCYAANAGLPLTKIGGVHRTGCLPLREHGYPSQNPVRRGVSYDA